MVQSSKFQSSSTPSLWSPQWLSLCPYSHGGWSRWSCSPSLPCTLLLIHTHLAHWHTNADKCTHSTQQQLRKTADADAYFPLLLGESHLWGQQWGDCCHVKDLHEKVSDWLGSQLLIALCYRPCTGRVPLSRRRYKMWIEEQGIWTVPRLFIIKRVVSELKLQMIKPQSSEATAEELSLWGCHLTTHSHLF